MKTKDLHAWPELQRWLDSPEWQEQHDGKPRFAFRGQADSSWPIRTSLARHFEKNPIDPHHWRRRELKMYRIFRERLLEVYRDMHKGWEALDILSLMQHYGAPTRLIDFSFSPGVAAYFALRDTRGESVIWVVDSLALEERRKELNLHEYYGPDHDPEYRMAIKDRLVGSIRMAKHPHERLAAQQGCFLVPGSISKPVSAELIHAKVKLSEGLVTESLRRLKGLGFDHADLYPKIKRLAREAKRFSVTGAADFPCADDDASQSRRS